MGWHLKYYNVQKSWTKYRQQIWIFFFLFLDVSLDIRFQLAHKDNKQNF